MTSQIIELVIFIILVVFIAALALLLLKISLVNRRLTAAATQAEMDRIMTMIQLEKMQSSNDVEKTDGFLKFVSESREWAFGYIEQVQVAIKEYDVALSNQDPTAMNEAYKKLIAMLPED
jgi:hypothetical protein